MDTELTQAPTSRRLLSAIASDRVLIALAAGFALLGAFEPGQLIPSVRFTLGALVEILPFVLLASALASLSSATGADGLIAEAFEGRPIRSVSLAAVAGALSPFCSCGVIPLIAALLRARVPLPPLMAFWIASPIMDPEMFVLTAAGISPTFAVAKTIAAIGMGLLAGLAACVFQGLAGLEQPLKTGTCEDTCAPALFDQPVQWRFWRIAERRERFRSGLGAMLAFLGKWLALAFFLESLMNTWVPAEAVVRLLGTGAWHEIPLAAAIGIPAYINGYAAIPLLAELIDKGMSPGAAMTFVTAGAVSSIPAAMAVAVLVKRRVFAAYLITGTVGAIVAGLLYALIAG